MDSMTKAEMQDMVDGFAEMFREYGLTLDDTSEAWRESGDSERDIAKGVFDKFTTWLWNDYFDCGRESHAG